MKILATSDWHLGLRPYGMKSREQDIYDAAMSVVDMAVRHKISLILNAGDILNVLRPQSEAVVFLSRLNDKLIENKIKMILIEGNHDKIKPHWTQAFRRDENFGIHVVNNETIEVGSGIKLFCMEETPKQDLLKILDSKKEKGECVDILMLHASFEQFIGFSGNKEKVLSADDSNFMNCKIAVIGDTHVSMVVEHNGIKFISPGSIETLNTSEALEKFCYIINTDDWSVEKEEILTSYKKLKSEFITDIESADEFISVLDKHLKTNKVFAFVRCDRSVEDHILKRLNVISSANDGRLTFIVRAKDISEELKILDNDDLSNDVYSFSSFNIKSIDEFLDVYINSGTIQNALSQDGKTLLKHLVNKELNDAEDRLNSYVDKKTLTTTNNNGDNIATTVKK